MTDAELSQDDRPRTSDGGAQAEIARAISGVFREATGRGPRVIHVYPLDGVITAVIFDTLTRLEATLVENGSRTVVVSARAAAIATRRDELVATVERATGRRVLSMHCDLEPVEDITVLSFVLERPAGATRER